MLAEFDADALEELIRQTSGRSPKGRFGEPEGERASDAWLTMTELEGKLDRTQEKRRLVLLGRALLVWASAFDELLLTNALARAERAESAPAPALGPAVEEAKAAFKLARRESVGGRIRDLAALAEGRFLLSLSGPRAAAAGGASSEGAHADPDRHGKSRAERRCAVDPDGKPGAAPASAPQAPGAQSAASRAGGARAEPAAVGPRGRGGAEEDPSEAALKEVFGEDTLTFGD